MPELSSGIHLQKAVGQQFSIYIPFRYTLGERVPLILLLHWGGRKYQQIGRDMLEIFGLPAFSELQAIIVAPNNKRRHWATSKAGEDLAKLIGYLDHNYNLDPNRRLVAGYSIGGVGVWFLGAEYPQLFSCGISIAAPIPENILETGWQFPVYSLHGSLDEVFPHEINFRRAQILKDKGAPVEFVTVENTMHRDLKNFIAPVENACSWIEFQWNN